MTLPLRADVIFSDLRGPLPLFERHIPSIVDARTRFLASQGTLIPRRDTLWAAVVEAPKPYGELVDPWDHKLLGQDLNSARQLIVNGTERVRCESDQLLTEPQLWTTLDYRNIEDPDVPANLDWRIARAGTGHGVLVWFDADLAEGTGFSNAPSAPETIYGSLFFPWTQPASLAHDQAVCVTLEARLVENDYVWRWTTRVEPREGSNDTTHTF